MNSPIGGNSATIQDVKKSDSNELNTLRENIRKIPEKAKYHTIRNLIPPNLITALIKNEKSILAPIFSSEDWFLLFKYVNDCVDSCEELGQIFAKACECLNTNEDLIKLRELILHQYDTDDIQSIIFKEINKTESGKYIYETLFFPKLKELETIFQDLSSGDHNKTLEAYNRLLAIEEIDLRYPASSTQWDEILAKSSKSLNLEQYKSLFRKSNICFCKENELPDIQLLKNNINATTPDKLKIQEDVLKLIEDIHIDYLQFALTPEEWGKVIKFAGVCRPSKIPMLSFRALSSLNTKKECLQLRDFILQQCPQHMQTVFNEVHKTQFGQGLLQEEWFPKIAKNGYENQGSLIINNTDKKK